MQNMWIFLSSVGALFQSVNAAINKRNLQVSRSALNLIGFINYFTAGVILTVVLLFQKGNFVPEISNMQTFLTGILIVAVFNTTGAYYGYRALHVADFNYVSPWIALTSILIVIPSYFMLGEIPSLASFVGIVLVVIGAIIIDYRRKKTDITAEETARRHINNKAKIFVLIMGICFTMSPVGMKMAIDVSSPMFVAVLLHFSIALPFLIIILLFQRGKIFSEIRTLNAKNKKIFFATALAAGFGYAAANGSISLAMGLAPVTLVMALKRIAPIFSFFIGYTFFKEKNNAKKKLLATLLMVAGAILVSVFK
jgi:drug/metabolite transporter (DMT)-like permease